MLDLSREYLDSRDLTEELERIEAEDEDGDSLDGADIELRDAIRELSEEGISDWEYGATLIRADYFEDYARQLADDIGAIDSEAGWPLSHIDWEAAADALKMDYSEVRFMGNAYYVRD